MTTDRIDTAVERDFICADADYFHTKARQCFRMAQRAREEGAATTLRSLGHAFEEKARTLES